MRYLTFGTLIAMAAGGVFLLRPRGTAGLDNRVLDVLTEWAGPGRQSDDVVLVEIDDRAIGKYGRWPWRRGQVGALIGRILDRGAKTVVLDMMFPEEGQSSSDDALAKAMAGRPVVIGYSFGFDGGWQGAPRCEPPALPPILGGESQERRMFFRATSAVCSAAALAGAAAGSGFLNVAPDSDGTVRRVPLIIEFEKRHHSSLALAAMLVDRKVSTIALKVNAGGATELRLDDRPVALEGAGLMRLRFRPRARPFPSLGAAEVLEKNGIAPTLNGKIVVVGVTAVGLRDTVITPESPVLSGLQLQATAIENLILGNTFSRPLTALAFEFALMFVAAAGLCLLLTLYPSVWAPLETATVIWILWVGCGWAAAQSGVLVSPLPASVAAACGYTVITLFQYRAEKRRADQTQEAIKESEARYERLVENINDAIIVDDLSGRLLFGNRRFREWFGLQGADIRSVSLEHYVAPEWRPLVRERHDRLVRGEPISGQIEFEGFRADGTRLWIEALMTTVEEDGKITGTQSALRDVTERKRMEAQYLQSQKMESLGRLAGGIAHDFNNLLTIINGYADVLLSKQGQDDETVEELQHICSAGARAAELTQKLLAFSRQQVANPRTVDLNAMVKEASRTYGRLIGADIEIVTRLSPAPSLVKGDPIQVTQILMNLLSNARDAMPEGGRLTIETNHVVIEEESEERRQGAAAGAYVRLGVSDTGVGMSEQVRQHIFEPFFTTKEAGKGTGLGLSTVHGLVRNYSGWVEVDSEPGKGATFHIYLPRIAVDTAMEESRRSSQSLTGWETVLLVEDEAAVRKYSRSVLERHGYRVLDASNGPEAMEVAGKYPDVIHLLLTDVVLPKMSGVVLAERLRASRPDMKVLFASGYSAELGSPAGTRYLQKPFVAAVLAAKVREVLAE